MWKELFNRVISGISRELREMTSRKQGKCTIGKEFLEIADMITTMKSLKEALEENMKEKWSKKMGK